MILAAAIGFTALSTAVSAYSAIQQGEAANRAARYNARVAEQQGNYARLAAAADAETRRRQLDRVLGTQRARYGASGVIASEGSPLLVMMQSEEEAALDVARVRHGGAVAAHGLQIEADLYRRQGRQAKRQAKLQAASNILTGLSGAASLYSKYTPPSSRAAPSGRSNLTSEISAYRGYGYD